MYCCKFDKSKLQTNRGSIDLRVPYAMLCGLHILDAHVYVNICT